MDAVRRTGGKLWLCVARFVMYVVRAPHSGRRRRAGVAVAAISLATCSVLLPSLNGGRGSESRGPQSTHRVSMARSWAALSREGSEGRGLSTSVRVLQAIASAHVTGHGMPAALRSLAQKTLGAGSDALMLDFARAREVSASRHLRLWLVPGRGVICMFRVTHFAAICAPDNVARARGLVLETYRLPAGKPWPPLSFTAIGVMPSSVVGAVAKTRGRTIVIPTRSNTFVRRSKSAINVTRPILRGTPLAALAR
jgi:hypothetical protein